MWAGEFVRAGDVVPAPEIADHTTLPGNHEVVTLARLVEMKLMANRDQDRVHLRDMIDDGLVDRSLLANLPDELARPLATLLDELGRSPSS